MGEKERMSPQVMGLYSEPMDEFRQSLDDLMKLLLVQLTERGLETGTLTAKIKVTLDRKTSGGPTMMQIEPDVSLKIGAKGGKKCRTQSGIFLFYNDEGEPIITGNQIGMMEYLQKQDDEERKGAG